MNTEVVKQAFEATINLLGQIPVPVSQYASIGTPIQHAINNMHIGLEAMKEEEKKPEIVSIELEEEESADGNSDAG